MPRKKITLEEAFAVFEEHGLRVKVEALQTDTPATPLEEFLEQPVQRTAHTVQPVSKKLVKITLFSQHSIAHGGVSVEMPNGTTQVEGSGVETYGPGIVTVPVELAHQLLYQDGLARSADEHMLDRKLRTYVVVPHGSTHRSVKISEDSGFDISSFLGQLGQQNMYHI